MAYNDPPTYVTKGLLPYYGDYPLYGATSIDNVSVGGSATRIEVTSLMDTTKKFVQGMRELGEINIAGNAPLQSDFVQWLYGEQENGVFHTFTLVIGSRPTGQEGITDGSAFVKDTSLQVGTGAVRQAEFNNRSAAAAATLEIPIATANKINGIIPGDFVGFEEAATGNLAVPALKITSVKPKSDGTAVIVTYGDKGAAFTGATLPATDSAITFYSPSIMIESSASVQSFNYSTPQDGVVQYNLMLNVTGEGTHTNGSPDLKAQVTALLA